MKVIISNDIEIHDYTASIYNWCEQNLIVTNPKYETLLKNQFTLFLFRVIIILEEVKKDEKNSS